MILKKKKNIPLKTSKPIMAKPIHIDDKLVIPIHYVNVEVFDLKFPNLFGTVESKGCVIVENNESTFLSLDETLDLEDLMTNIPELEKVLTKQKQGGTHEH